MTTDTGSDSTDSTLSSDDAALTVAISARRVWQILTVVVGLLTALHVAGQYSAHVWGHPSIYGLVPRFNMNGEASVPTFFATLLFVASAAMLGLIAVTAWRSGDSDRLGWAGLTLLFAFLAVDEAAALHEMANRPLREALDITEGWLYFAWSIPGAVAVVALTLIFRPFVLALPSPTRRGLLLGVLLLLAGALGVETIGGWYRSTRGNDFGFALLAAVEETLEMAGTIVILCTFIAHYARTYADVRLRFLAR